MVRTTVALGIGLIGFGAGMIFAVCLHTGWCAVIFGGIILIAGTALVLGNGT